MPDDLQEGDDYAPGSLGAAELGRRAAKALGYEPVDGTTNWVRDDRGLVRWFDPCLEWRDAGELIERLGLRLWRAADGSGRWRAAGPAGGAPEASAGSPRMAVALLAIRLAAEAEATDDGDGEGGG